jgi:hypothetical protein
MKILVYKGKHGDQYYDASTPEKELASYAAIFAQLYEWGYYGDDQVEVSTRRGKREFYEIADVLANQNLAKEVLTTRSSVGYEYEIIEVEHLIDPTKE